VCITTQLPFWRMSAEHAVTGAALLPDGATVCLADNRGVLKRVETLTSRNRWRSAVEGAAFRSVAVDDGGQIVLTADGTSVRAWAADSGGQRATVHAPTKVAFQGPLLALGGERLAVASGPSVLLYDHARGELTASLHDGDAIVRALAAGPDGTLLAGASDGTIRVWQPGTPEPLKVLRAHERAVVALSVAPDAAWFATASEDRSVRVWTLPGDALLAEWLLDSPPTSCAFGPGGRLLIGEASGHVLPLLYR
jgi:WD40 repeat protein